MAGTTVESSNSLASWRQSSRIRVTPDGALSLGCNIRGSVSQAGATTAALLQGSGTTTTRVKTATADKNFIGYWTESSAASGDCRGMYIRTYFSGTGSGEAARLYATVNAAGAAAGGTINGAHISTSIAASASVAGQANAARITLDAAADTRNLSRNIAALMIESNIAAGNTVHADTAFVRVVDTGAVAIKNLLRLAAPGIKSSGDMFLARHADAAATHAIQISDEAGTKYWLMVTTDTPAD